MEPRKRPEYVLEVLADPTCVKDVVRGILHTIFFHRYFPSMRPSCLEVLDLTLPVVADPELETLIETRVGQLVRQLSSTSSPSGGSRGELGVRFFEKHRRKAGGLGGWLTGTGKSEEEVCWEVWKLKITLTTPRTETERMTLLRAEAPALHKTAMTIVKIVNRDKDHIPPITTSETNPFPYEILLNPRAEYDGKAIGFFS
ncbi:MAG: hypothetical protein Q9223_000640 [Gallowayella weberi]